MKLGTKLILAFLLLAVLPLTWVTLYSYQSSIRAFRRAVEAESGALADDMGSRMESLKKDLEFRVERLGRLPLRQLLALGGGEGARVDAQSNPVMADIMAEIGDAAPLLDAIEFQPEPSGPKAKPPLRAKKSASATVAKRGSKIPADAHRLVIHFSPETSAPATGSKPSPPADVQGGVVMHFRPSAGRLPAPDASRMIGEAEKQKLEERLKQLQEFQVVIEKITESMDRQRAAAAALKKAEAVKRLAGQIPQPPRIDPLASGFSSVVHTDGSAVGTVSAHVSSSNVYRSILSRGRRRSGEIPFVVDADNTLHTIGQEDRKKLEALQVPGNPQPSAGVQAESPELKDWVVVTRKDEQSAVTFGIARPVSEPLREIRNTAVRNLGYGLGMVGLALLGIVLLSGRLTRRITALTQGAEELARGNLNVRVPVQSHDEIGRLAEGFNRMAHDLNEYQKHLVERESLRKELEMSRRIQEELLPKLPLQAGAIEIKGVSIPAKEVGGDFFNYFPLPNEEVAILVGDVSGKGVAAALLMANFQATLQARLPLADNLQKLAEQLDRELAASTPQEVYLTLFMGILNLRQNRLRYVSAGHNPQFALHEAGSIERLESTGRPLGLLPGGDFAERSIRLTAGDALFLYTDGLVEAADPAGREFGQRRLEGLLLEAHNGNINDILMRVETEVRKHRADIEAGDDATMLVLKISSRQHRLPYGAASQEL